jgi:hypothetical protein
MARLTDDEIKLLHHGIGGLASVLSWRQSTTTLTTNPPTTNPTTPTHYTQSMLQPTATASDQDDPSANLMQIRIN